MSSPERDTIGRYDLLLELGRGGMAVLYLARAQGVGGFSRLFAIKQILPHLAADPLFVDMFLNEGRIAARLSHPNLCPVFELAQERGELFLVMEYLDGVPWEALAAAAPRDARGLQLTAGVLAQACEGLHYAHTFRDVDGTAMPIVHRDVSPQNLFVSADGVCRVLDFGVSKVATDHRRTRTGLLKGKLPYMAPEQLRGEPLDGRADIWAVGVMLWEALTGQRLFDRDTDFLTYLAIIGAEIPSVSAGASRYPPAIDRVIARALARDREARHPTARELGHDLQQVAASVGGASSRDQIAATVTALCGPQLAARRHAIAAAVTTRSTVRPDGSPAGPGSPTPTDGSRDRPITAPDAAETISMAMRRDAIVVARRRRTKRTVAILATLAALAAGVVVMSASRSGQAPEPAQPVIAESSARTDLAHPPASPPPPPESAAQPRSSAHDSSPTRGHPSAQAEMPIHAVTEPVPSIPAGDPVAPPPRSRGRTPPATATTRPRGSQSPQPPSRQHAQRLAIAGDRPGDATLPDDRTASDDRTPADRTASDRTASDDRTAADRTAADRTAADRTAADRTPSDDRTAADRTPSDDRAPSASRRALGAEVASGDRIGTSPAGDRAPAMGWYAIDSNPYATIYVDGRKLGDTPLDRIPLTAGTHRVRAVLPDGRERSFAIDIAPDRKTTSGTLTW